MIRQYRVVLSILLMFISGSLILSGCSENNVVEPAEGKMSVEGHVYNVRSFEDIFTAGSAVGQAQVDLFRVTGQGELEKMNVYSAGTDDNGKYKIETESYITEPCILIARKNDSVWKGIVCSPKADGEVVVYAQPLTRLSTAQAALYQDAVKKNYSTAIYDISLAVNEEIADYVLSGQDNLTAISGLLNSAVQSRNTALLKPYFGGSESQIEFFNKGAQQLNLMLSRDLYFASSVENIELLTDNYYQSYVDMFTDSGVSRDKILKLLEVYYRVITNSSPADEDGKLGLLKSSAYLRALVFNNSIISDFNSLKGNKHVGNIKSAANVLKKSIKSAGNFDRISSSFRNYNNLVLENLFIAAGINNGLKNSLERKILTDRNILYSELQGEGDPAKIIEAYINYYNDVSPELKKLLKNVYKEESDIIAEMMILLYINI